MIMVEYIIYLDARKGVIKGLICPYVCNHLKAGEEKNFDKKLTLKSEHHLDRLCGHCSDQTG